MRFGWKTGTSRRTAVLPKNRRASRCPRFWSNLRPQNGGQKFDTQSSRAEKCTSNCQIENGLFFFGSVTLISFWSKKRSQNLIIFIYLFKRSNLTFEMRTHFPENGVRNQKALLKGLLALLTNLAKWPNLSFLKWSKPQGASVRSSVPRRSESPWGTLCNFKDVYMHLSLYLFALRAKWSRRWSEKVLRTFLGDSQRKWRRPFKGATPFTSAQKWILKTHFWSFNHSPTASDLEMKISSFLFYFYVDFYQQRRPYLTFMLFMGYCCFYFYFYFLVDFYQQIRSFNLSVKFNRDCCFLIFFF